MTAGGPAAARFLPLAEPWLPEEAAEAVRRQVASGFIGPGETTRVFGEALARVVGVAHAVPTVSGTVALSVAARALGLGPGDEILVPAYGVISTINAFASMGLAPRLVDIDRRTGCMDPDRLRAAIGPETRAVCFVNFSGATGPDLEAVAGLCAGAGLPLIEDAACALGHRHAGRAAGSFGTLSVTSFSVPKVISTGQGGAVLTNEAGLRDAALSWIDQGDLDWRRTNLNRAIGTNLRFNDVLAALGLSQLEALDSRLARRRAVFAALKARLGSALFQVPGDEAPLHNIVFSDDPDALVARLRAQGVGAARQYRTLSQHPPYQALAGDGFPGADHWTGHAVYLPFGMALTPEDGDRIGRAVLADPRQP
jgi:perosamine synthetase